MEAQERAPRRQCHVCNGWSRELVEVQSELGKSFPYYAHAHEVEGLKAQIKEARREMKARKEANLAEYGQRYAH